MAGKFFAQINASLLNSKKFKQLNHVEKWAYVCAHLTPLGSFAGQFSYPAVMWTQDACLQADELEPIIERLVELGLIEWNSDEEMVRIVGFHRQRPPENASKTISLLADYSSVAVEGGETRGMSIRGISELIAAAFQRAQGWRPDSPEWPKLRDAVGPFLHQIYQQDGEEFASALRSEVLSVSKATLHEIESLFPEITLHETTVSAPCPHPPLTRDLDKTRRRRDEDKDEENTLGEIAEIAASASSQAEVSDLQRKQLGPTEATKQSRLAQRQRSAT